MILNEAEMKQLSKERMQVIDNMDFMKTIFSIAEKYQIFKATDISMLTSSEKCHERFSASSKPILVDITGKSDVEINDLIRDKYDNNRGYTRYYKTPVYTFNGRKYLASNDMYGKRGSHNNSNNRDPLYNWFMQIICGMGKWFPSEQAYEPNITQQQWKDILTDNRFVTQHLMLVLARYYDIGGTATVRQLVMKYGATENYYKMTCMNLIKKMINAGICAEAKLGENARLWPVMFLGRNASESEPGDYVWKLRPELYAALEQMNISQYLNSEGGEEVLSHKDALSKIKEYIAGQKYFFPNELIDNFYLCLKSKPFVILAGISGTGKSKLVELFAEACGATDANGRFLLVPVKPDWSDSSDLLGHKDIAGNFVEGEIIAFIKDATEHLDKPYFLCLDEMNLARVEYYFSDFLSVIETRKQDKNGIIRTKSLIGDEALADKKDKYHGLYIPENLYVIGTVNMDETTFPFSKKVLDRANTIEFSDVDLKATKRENVDASALDLDNSFLKTEYLQLPDEDENWDTVVAICDELETINKELKAINAQVAFRVRDELVAYMIINKHEGLLDYDTAMDNEINQKILPRLQGSSFALKRVLCNLFKLCATKDFEGNNDIARGDIATGLEKALLSNADKNKYPKSAAKIVDMVRRFEEDGFTSYWT